MRAEPPAAPSPTPPVGGVEAEVTRVLRLVAAVRQLPPKGPVTSRVLRRPEMLDRVKAQMRTDLPEAVARGNETFLVACGVVPIDFDFEASVLQLFDAQLSGFYDPDAKTLFLASDLGRGEDEATLAHELVHALQDQHFGLGARVKYRPGASDELSAIHGLAEGDATSAMADEMLAGRGLRAIDLGDERLLDTMREAMERAAGTGDVPAILKRSLLAPYLDGLALVHWARRQGGWSRVDEIWRTPPTTTEQLLHPEKLVAREPPEVVATPTPPKRGPAQLLYDDVMGEQSVRLLVEEWLPDDGARGAARGWGGDRAAVFCDADLCAVAWHVRYDDEPGAGRGLVGLGAGVLAARQAEARATRDAGRFSGRTGASRVAAIDAWQAAQSGSVCEERDGTGPLAVVRSGRDVVLVAGPFRRGRTLDGSAGDCAASIQWAREVAAQR
jgi:hypothetical protein